MSIRSSWHSDRIAANLMEKQRACVRRSHKKSNVKVMKASDLYIREYGEKAYLDWMLREEKIDALMRSGECSKHEICRLREESFRRMKTEGASHDQQPADVLQADLRPYAPAA
ncbi:MAG: hypothetical protein IKF72_10150 [Kiritimatiellae bacterium]|nr:hypothetical protein [Kiritimatiellia bacterium]